MIRCGEHTSTSSNLPPFHLCGVGRFATREKFMTNIMTKQPFTEYTRVKELIQESEKLFNDIAALCRDAQNEKLTLQVVCSFVGTWSLW